jgi:hypothetical protein
MSFVLYQPITLIVSTVLLVLILMAFVFRKRLFQSSRKPDYKYLMEKEILTSYDSQDEPDYNKSIEERAYNRKLNERKIYSLKSLDVETKAHLIKNNIETVGELKFSSLDFLLDVGHDDSIDQQKLNSFYACKNFISACQYKKGKSHLDL